MQIRMTLLTLMFAFAFTATAVADDMKVPQTAAEHVAMAKQYKDEAVQYNKVSANHKAMAEAYKKSSATPVDHAGKKNPFLEKMEKHCAMIASDADKLSADANKAAEYHTLRAKELQGK